MALGSDIGPLISTAAKQVLAGLPAAAELIGDWLYAWQALIAGILAIAAAHLWGTAVIRAAQLYNSQQSTPAPPSRRAPPLPSARMADLRETAPKAMTPASAVTNLRGHIRNVLTRIPCEDRPLTPEQVKLCARTAQALPDGALFANDASRSRFLHLQKAIADLQRLSTSDSCTKAWQALTEVNKRARELQSALSPEPVQAAE